MQNGFGIPLPYLFLIQTYQAVLEGITILVLLIDKRIHLPDLRRDVTKTGNGERGAGSGERGAGSGERGTEVWER